MAIICANDVLGLGSGCGLGNSFTQMKRAILALPTQEFTSLANFADSDEWIADVVSEEIFPLPEIMELEDMTTEGVVYEAGNGKKVGRVVNPIRGYKMWLYLTVDQHKAIWELRGKDLRIYKIDDTNNVKATSPDGTKVRGFRVSFFDVEPMKDATAEKPALTAITIQESSIEEFELNGVEMNPNWLFEDIQPLTQVVVTAGNITSNTIPVTVAFKKTSKINADGTIYSLPVSGLLAANFYIIDQTGAVETPTVTEGVRTSTTQAYSLACASITSGTLKIVPSTTNLYKSAQITVASA